MGMLEDILKALDRIPGWKRLQELPSEMDDRPVQADGPRAAYRCGDCRG
jgi:hypothetical protein